MRYYIVAGEASGDLHGSNLVKGLLAEDSQAEIRCWGGDLMKDAGATLVRHYKDTAVMGVTDVITKARKILGNVSFCKKDILDWKPDVVILIDYPGFNFKIAEFAHKKGFKVFYYIAPKTWASREKRNEKLRNYVDKLFIIFPFEEEYFSKRGINYIYKGNPLLDAVDNHFYACPSTEKYIAVLPGSRKSELSHMMPVCMEAAAKLGTNVIVAGAPGRTMADYEPYLKGRQGIKVVFGRTYDILKFSQAAIINSGTASLEAALIGTPQVVGYSTSPFNAWVARKVLRVLDNIKFISLGNLIIDRPAFRELIQEDFTAYNLVAEVGRLTSDTEYREHMLAEYKAIRDALGGTGASRAVAKAMIGELTR